MNQMQMMDLDSHIRKLWDAGSYRGATKVAEDRLDGDELEESLGERDIAHRDTLLEDLHGELQYQARQLTDPDDDIVDVQKVVNEIKTVQKQDAVWFDVGIGLLYAEPISRDDFIEAVDSTNDLLNGIQDEE